MYDYLLLYLIGVRETFVHLDIDERKSQYAAWIYFSGARLGVIFLRYNS